MSEKLTAAIEWLRKMGNTSHGIAVLDNDQRDDLLAHLDGQAARIAELEADLKEADAAYTEDALRAEKAEAEKEELEVDLADSYRLRERLDTLLTGIADNLLGYDPNIAHDWSRLPELIRQVREVGVTVVGEHPKTFAKNTRAEESEAVVKELKLENATKEREILRLLNVVCSAPACTAAVIRRDDGSRVCAAGHPARWVNIDLLTKAEEEIKELRSKLADAEHWKVKY